MNATAPALNPIWLTVKQAAERMQVSTALIYQNIKQHRLRAARLGYRNDIRIREDWLEAWALSLSEPHEIEAPSESAGPIAFSRRGRKR